MRKEIQFFEKWLREFNDYTTHIFDRVVFVSAEEGHSVAYVRLSISKFEFEIPFSEDPREAARRAVNRIGTIMRNFASAIAMMRKYAEN